MRLPALAACLSLLAIVVGCQAEGSTTDEVVSERAFRDAVVSAIVTSTDLHSQPGFGPEVDVSEPESLDRLEIPLRQPYARYRNDPDRRSEIVAEVVDRARQRLERGLSGAGFAEVEPNLMPVLKPRPSLARLGDRPAANRVVGDLVVVYALDNGREFLTVTPADVERWGRPLAELHALALDNLHRRTERDEPLVCEPAARGELCGWASADGYDATRMLVPELRDQITRRIGRAVYAVPREDVYVALAVRYAERIRTRVLQQFTTAENPVSPELFVERDGELVVLEE